MIGISKRVLTVGVLVAAAATSFFVAYTALDYVDNARFWRRVTAEDDIGGQIRYLGNAAANDFPRGAAEAGFSLSRTIEGAVDTALVVPGQAIHLSGWALDRQTGDKAVSVFLIVPKVAVYMTVTRLERPDVADALLFPRDFVRPGYTDTFETRADCRQLLAANPYLVMVNADRQYAIIRQNMPFKGC